MATNDDLTPEFEKLDMPNEEFEAALSEGMPDPIAQPEEPVEKKSKKKSKKKKEKKKRSPKVRSSEKTNLVVSILGASPYTVLLAISFIAIMVAVLYMAFQIIEYGGDYKAKAAKQSAAVGASARFVDPTPIEIV